LFTLSFPVSARLLLSCLLCFWLSCPPAQALPVSQQQQVDQLIQATIDSQHLVGLALGVVKNGEIAYLKGYGWANREQRQAVTLRSRFRWASVSKPVTAILSMQLLEQGQLALDQPITRWLPDYQNPQGWPVTQRQLLSHQAGIGHYADVPEWSAGLRTFRQAVRSQQVAPTDMQAASALIFGKSPLLFRPGSAYHYSTFGYLLAGAVLSAAGQQPYLQQFNERIAQPLGLTSMVPDFANQQIPERVAGYYQTGQTLKARDPQHDVSWKLAGGGFTSNVHDMTRLMQALIRHELIQAQSAQLMWTPQTTSTGKVTHYGLGFGLSRPHGTRQQSWLRVGHSGSQEATRTDMHFWPEQRFGLVLMSNSEWAELAPVREQLYALLNKT